jgi:hypothetical protein
MVVLLSGIALLQVLIMDKGFLNLKHNITHLSSSEETWPNSSSFTQQLDRKMCQVAH